MGGIGTAVGAGLSWLANQLAGNTADTNQNQPAQQPPQNTQSTTSSHSGPGYNVHSQTFTFSNAPSSSNQPPQLEIPAGFPFAGLFGQPNPTQNTIPSTSGAPNPSFGMPGFTPMFPSMPHPSGHPAGNANAGRSEFGLGVPRPQSVCLIGP